MNLSRSRRRAAALGILAGVTAFALTACGDTGGDAANGKKLFATCAGCHTLADYDAKMAAAPKAGPNLDDAFRQARQAGVPEDQFEGVVHRWIAIAQGEMPRNLLKGQDAKDVAAYVASVAGKSEESAVEPAGPPTPEVVPVRFRN